MLWGYCDSCSAEIHTGDSCWVEQGYDMDEAKTFCAPCWDSSPACMRQQSSCPSGQQLRSVQLEGHRGRTPIRARWATISAGD